jgi:DNA topoisomerase VI subunit B
LRASQKLSRTTFITSRTMDFFNEKELVTQTGHPRHEWPLVFVKEMVDNALDACDEADVPPVIAITCDARGIAVADNGPGLPESTLARAMDFSVRASNREAYVAPDRGAQGNALKTIIPMPAVIDPVGGRLVIEAHGKRHSIRCRADQISQQPVVDDNAASVATAGTSIRMEWNAMQEGDAAAWPFPYWRFRESDGPDRIKSLVAGFALFNPHATIRLDWFGERIEYSATAPGWPKWRPCQPTSPHWYTLPQIERLIGAYITHDRAGGKDRLVSEFVSEFDGLTGSAKRATVLDACGLKRVHLSELAVGGNFDHARTADLLAAMQANTKPVKSRRLGIIGEEHFRVRLLAMGCTAESITYRRQLAKAGTPYVIETAFAMQSRGGARRLFFAGANWSAGINNPFRAFGATGEGLEAVLANARASASEPIALAVHLAMPGVRFTDRGKTAIVIDRDDAEDDE